MPWKHCSRGSWLTSSCPSWGSFGSPQANHGPRRGRLQGLAGREHPGGVGATRGGSLESAERIVDRPVPGVDRETSVVDRDERPPAEDLAGQGRLLGLHRGGERTGRLEVGKVDRRAVDRRENDIEWAVAARHPPPVPVEDRVAEVEHPLAVRLNRPGDLRIAETIDRWKRGHGEGPGLDSLPDGDLAPPDAGPFELRGGLREREVLGVAS